MVDLVEVARGPVYVFGNLQFDSGHWLPIGLPPNEWDTLARALTVPSGGLFTDAVAGTAQRIDDAIARQHGASPPPDATATSSPEGAGGHSVEALRGSGPQMPSPLAVEGCTCPWNNGYVLPAVVRHHVDCPTLQKQHHPFDDCRPGGHRDDECQLFTDRTGTWTLIWRDGGMLRRMARRSVTDEGVWVEVPYVE